MNKTLRYSLLLCALMAAAFGQAQVRYLDSVFASVTKDVDVVYGQNKTYGSGFNATQPLKMDVFRPAGDTATNRPVIILMHAGSFLDGSVTGFNFADKNEHCIVELCERYAKRGYVAVSMTYRLGWNPTGTQNEKSKTIINAVFRAMQDVKNCIRYFRHDVDSNNNQWGINPNKIVLGGSNSGAYVALAAGNLNKPHELEIPKVLDINGVPFIDTTLTGNFDGFGGTQNVNNYPGYSSAFSCVLALGGAVADTTLIEQGEPPVIAFQGADETLTPYNTAVVITTTLAPVIEVSGSGDFMPVVQRLGLNTGFAPNSFSQGPKNIQGGMQTVSIDGLYPFYGQAFEPWNWYDGGNPAVNTTASQPKAMRYIDTIMMYSTPRLYRLFIDTTYGEPVGIREVQGSIEMGLYPNPANTQLNVAINSAQQPIVAMQVFDLAGRMISEYIDVETHNATVNVREFNSGVYLVSVRLKDGTAATRRFTVE